MEIKEAISLLKGLKITLIYAMDKNALQTAISHLETLQKVKEMGGVKKREGHSHSCEFDCRGCDDSGFNRAINLKDAELAGKLAGLEEYLESKFPNAGLRRIHLKMIINKIQEFILGKKEE